MDSHRRLVPLPDGRNLDVLVGDADSTAALLLMNGSPTGGGAAGRVAPFEAEGVNWLDGMAPENHEEFGAAASDPAELEAFLERFAIGLREVTAEGVADELGGLVPPVDRAALTGDFASHAAA